MARSFLAACLIVGLSALAAPPAAAQFNPFEALFGSPPRPPGGVPGGRQPMPPAPQEAYPDQQPYPGRQPYPGQAGLPPQGSGGGIQSQPLPAPGGTAAVDPRGPLSTPPPGQRPPARPPIFAAVQYRRAAVAEDHQQGRLAPASTRSLADHQFRRCDRRDWCSRAAGHATHLLHLPAHRDAHTELFIEVDEVTLQARPSASSPAGCLRRARVCMGSST